MSDLVLAGIGVARGGVRVLDGVDAAFPGGTLSVVIGPNGAGKSTMLEIAAGLLRPATGTVTLGGAPLPGRVALARRRAYLPQNPRADWPISVERVVALGLTPSLPAFGRLPVALSGAIDAALAAHDLLHLRERPATALSGGELARVMLARATVADPELLIVDEPTAGLDPRHAIAAVQALRARADAGRTVVVALHDLDLALRVADHVVAIDRGRVHAAGPAADVLREDVLASLYDVAVRISGGAIRFG